MALGCRGKAALIALAKQQLIGIAWTGVGDDGPHGVEHEAARQVECGRDFHVACWLGAPLGAHELGARGAQLHARESVNGVVDAVVPGHEAPEHLVVRGVDDGIGGKKRDISAPEGYAVAIIERSCACRASALNKALLQICILDGEYIGREGFWHARIHECPQQLSLFCFFLGDFRQGGFSALLKKGSDKKEPAVRLIHQFRSFQHCGSASYMSPV